MIRAFFLSAIVLSLLVLTTGGATAQSGPHFAAGPVVTDLGTSLNATGTISGLEDKPTVVIVGAIGEVTVDCVNRNGRVRSTHTFERVVMGDNIYDPVDGSVTFDLTTDPLPPFGVCRANQTEVVSDIEFYEVTAWAFQDNVAVLAQEI